MNEHSYHFLDDPRPRFGLIVLQVDETIEDDVRRMFAPHEVRIHVSRVPSGDKLNPDTIRTMAATLPAAAGLLPPAIAFDAVGYACTSGTALIGADRVRDLVQSACTTKAVTDPLTATVAAIRALGLKRVGIVSPYIASVAAQIGSAFDSAGITVPGMAHFGEEVEENVARIAPESIGNAARDLAMRTDFDGIFLSCTNMRTLDLIPSLESMLGVPVLSSNQALAWHLARLLKNRISVSIPGSLGGI